MKIGDFEPLTGFLDLLLEAVCVVDAEGRFVFVSAAFEQIFGYSPEEVIGTQMIDLVAPDDRERTLEAAGEIMSGDPRFTFENRYVRKDGQVVHIMWSARWSEVDHLRIAVARDITARKQAESLQAAVYAISEAAHAAEDLKALFHLIHQIIGKLLPVTSLSVALYDEDTDALTYPYQMDEEEVPHAPHVQATSAFCAEIIETGQALLLTPNSLQDIPEKLHAVSGCNALCWMGVPLTSNKITIGALILKSDAGVSCYTEKDVELVQFVSTQVVTAIERKKMHSRLQHMAHHDKLTGLPNRALLHDRLERMLSRTHRRRHGHMAVLYIDLNEFKQVNDLHGHEAGDMLLQKVAIRIKKCLRDSDTVARMGGDEFVVLLEDIICPQCANIVSEKIRGAVSEPVTFGDFTICVEPSIGIALFPEHGEEAGRLLKHADEAMYTAKKSSEKTKEAEIEKRVEKPPTAVHVKLG